MATGSTGDVFASHVYFRTGGRLPRSSGAGYADINTESTNPISPMIGQTCIAYVNYAYSLISGAATYVWDTTFIPSLAVSAAGQVDLSAAPFSSGLSIPEIGSNIEFTNINGLPITRTPYEVALQGQQGQFISINTSLYNNWYIVRPASSSLEPGLVQFQPPMAGTVSMLYNRLPNYLTDGPSGFTSLNGPNGAVAGANIPVPWLQWFVDELLISFAEMMIKRVLNMGGWQELEQQCLAKLQDVRTMFSAQRTDSGPPAELQSAKTETDPARA